VPDLLPAIPYTRDKHTSFRLSVATHTPRSHPLLPDFMSDPDRIAFDLDRVSTLAALLDEDRGVSDESSLFALLNSLPDLAPSDQLDVGLAYLRRVHFYVYYSGKAFTDESQVLAKSAFVICRSSLHSPVAVEESDQNVETNGDGDVDNIDVEKESDSNGKVEESEETVQVNQAVYKGKSNKDIEAIDAQVTDFLGTLTRRVEGRRSVASNDSTENDFRTEDERDAEVIAAEQDIVSINCAEVSPLQIVYYFCDNLT
jgi:hypothetical protein